MEDHYKTLGISRSAPADEIKKAYRRLARDHHPDRNPGDARAEDRFKQISKAYATLGDAAKRAAYDRGGTPAAGGPFPGQQAPVRKRNPLAPRRGADLEVDARIPFDMTVKGGEARIVVQSSAACDSCAGTGSAAKSKAELCSGCGGGGAVATADGRGAQPCPRCGGNGAVIAKPCRDCRAIGTKNVQRNMTVKVPAGVRDGTRIRLAGKGRVGLRGGPPGDLFVVTQVEESQVFRRKGSDFEVEVPITVVEAMLGATIEVPTLTGIGTIEIQPGTAHGSIKKARAAGPPKVGSSERSDIHYRIVVVIPSALTPRQLAAVESLADVLGQDNPRAAMFAGKRPAPA